MTTGQEDPRPRRETSPEKDHDSGDSQGEYWRWCPRCGHELFNEKCKLHCPRCHYFLSCSDFD
jgi:ribosomal protein S27AE